MTGPPSATRSPRVAVHQVSTAATWSLYEVEAKSNQLMFTKPYSAVHATTSPAKACAVTKSWHRVNKTFLLFLYSVVSGRCRSMRSSCFVRQLSSRLCNTENLVNIFVVLGSIEAGEETKTFYLYRKLIGFFPWSGS